MSEGGLEKTTILGSAINAGVEAVETTLGGGLELSFAALDVVSSIFTIFF